MSCASTLQTIIDRLDQIVYNSTVEASHADGEDQMNEILSWLVPLLATAIVGVVAWVVRLAVMLTKMQADSDARDRKLDSHIQQTQEHVNWNRGQHEELFISRNGMEKVLERLTTLFEGMDKKQDAMDRKLDTLIERRGTAR